MAPIDWIIGFAVICLLFWYANRSNRKRGAVKRRASVQIDLERENYRLRHVLAQMSVENHALRYTPPDRW